MDGGALSPRQLQRAVLARQQLLERAPPAAAIADIVGTTAGLQMQYAPTAYIGLWSRIAGFERADLTRALERRDVVQATLLRGTIHLVAASDYWPLRIAIEDVLRRWLLRRNDAPPEKDVRIAADRVRAALDGGEHVNRRRLDELAGDVGAVNISTWVDLVRVPPSGTWERRRADLYALADDWVGRRPQLSVDGAREHLVRFYLTGFGPASVNEIASFASMTIGDIRPAAERVAERRWLADDGTELLDLDGLSSPEAETTAPVRFLGTWESILLAHARRALVIREEDRSKIFATRIPQSLPTFLVDGQVAGTWRCVDGRIELDPWRPLPASHRRAVDEEADRLAAFHR